MDKSGKKVELKKIGQIMEEMGFNPQASQSAKASFIKYLAKQAYNVDIKIPDIYKNEGEGTLDSLLKPKEIEQLSFTLEEYKKVD